MSKSSNPWPIRPKRPTRSSKEELALLGASDNPHGEPAHFDMKAILKVEKQGKSRHKSKKHDRNDVDDGLGETR